MYTSLFDLFRIGIGPSSSHTVGPMRAARRFVELLRASNRLHSVERLRAEFFGSLGLTGKGHGSDRGVLLGWMGETPDSIEPGSIHSRVESMCRSGRITLPDGCKVRLDPEADLVFHSDRVLPGHSNAMRFTAFDGQGSILETRVYYSVGGGFIREQDGPAEEGGGPVPFVFRTASELLELAADRGLTIPEIVWANEASLRTEEELRAGIRRVWKVMQDCIGRGLRADGVLPGELRVQRRAAQLATRLRFEGSGDPLNALDWLSAWAMAVTEENAAGGQVVTAPTNGAAGVIPAVARYYTESLAGTDAGIERFFLAASAIGSLYRENASISGAEVGCQGEVGTACSMAAAGLSAALGATNEQIEHAAEIAMEHNLGLTCDPIGGLVQIPCIERNAFGAVKAVSAVRLALRGHGEHKVSLDQVIRTMYQTGLDMRSQYKETSLGGLAVNVVEC